MFPSTGYRVQVAEGHRDRMREAVWVALWSDKFLHFFLFLVMHLHMCRHVAHSMFMTSFAFFVVLETAETEIVLVIRKHCFS